MSQLLSVNCVARTDIGYCGKKDKISCQETVCRYAPYEHEHSVEKNVILAALPFL